MKRSVSIVEYCPVQIPIPFTLYSPHHSLTVVVDLGKTSRAVGRCNGLAASFFYSSFFF